VESRTFDPVNIPEGRYFMLGDNRQMSKDSVFYGPVGRDAITGRVAFIYSPTGRMGRP
jgi:signal peptidase I